VSATDESPCGSVQGIEQGTRAAKARRTTMAEHNVYFSVPERLLAKTDIVFVV
jgi:hypothetical protein